MKTRFPIYMSSGSKISENLQFPFTNPTRDIDNEFHREFWEKFIDAQFFGCIHLLFLFDLKNGKQRYICIPKEVFCEQQRPFITKTCVYWFDLNFRHDLLTVQLLHSCSNSIFIITWSNFYITVNLFIKWRFMFKNWWSHDIHIKPLKCIN